MATAKKAPAKAAPTKKSAPAPRIAPPEPATSATKKAAPIKTSNPTPEPVKAAVSKAAAPKAAAPKAAVNVVKTSAPASADAKAPIKKAAPKRPFGSIAFELPPVKGVSKEGVSYTKDFDVKFLTAMRTLLLEEKQSLLGQAIRLEDEANSLIEESEMGDVQFDDEGGEGDTMVVERERDLALSAQARFTIEEIDGALERIEVGSYGYSIESGRPISRERLEAIPWATVLVEEKVGGIGRR